MLVGIQKSIHECIDEFMSTVNNSWKTIGYHACGVPHLP